MDDYRERYDKMRESLGKLINEYLMRSVILDKDGKNLGGTVNFITDFYDRIIETFHRRFNIMEEPYNLVIGGATEDSVYSEIARKYNEKLSYSLNRACVKTLYSFSNGSAADRLKEKFPVEVYKAYLQQFDNLKQDVLNVAARYGGACGCGEFPPVTLFAELAKRVQDLVLRLAYEASDYCSSVEDKFLEAVFEVDWQPRLEKMRQLRRGETTKEFVFFASFFRDVSDVLLKRPFISSSVIVSGVRMTYDKRNRQAAYILKASPANIALMSLSDGNTYYDTLDNYLFQENKENSTFSSIFEVDRKVREEPVLFSYAYGNDTFKAAPFEWFGGQLRRNPDTVNETVLRDYVDVEGFLIRHTCPETFKDTLVHLAFMSGKSAYLWNCENDTVTRLV